MAIWDKTTGVKGGVVFNEEQKLVIVHDGTRGPRGVDGEQGVEGPAGESINILGAWASGTEYCPNDAVTWRSSAADGIQSLYIQADTTPCSISDIEPQLDAPRWQEIGATDLQNVTGAIWTIYQTDHQFEYVGTPVAFGYVAGRWIKADNRLDDEIAIAVVREVIDKDRAVLQTTGEVPKIDPRIIWPDGSDWILGRLYNVSAIRGRVTLPDPDPLTNDPSALDHPILMPTKFHESVDDNQASVGVVLPWRPDMVQRDYRVVGQLKFYYTATAGQSVVSGADLQGNSLEYQSGVNTDVFLNGVNLSEIDDYTATDGTSITFPIPLAEGDHVEVWTPDRPLDIIVQSTAAKMDNIENQFDGVRTDFPITIDGGTPIAVQATPNIMMWLDANPQEAFTDFNTIPDPADPIGGSLLRFTAAPQLGDRFWGLIGIPVGDNRFIVPRWRPNALWEPDATVIAPDPDYPNRGDNDPLGRRWDAFWKNETGGSIPPSPTFDTTLWTIVSRPRDNDIHFRVREYDPTFLYRRDDQIHVPPITGSAPAHIYRCKVNSSTVGPFLNDEWDRITNIALYEHDPLIGYRSGEEVIEQDHERSTFVSRYKNNTSMVIPAGPFDPTGGAWTRTASEYSQPWGYEFTQTGLMTGGNMSKSGPLEILVAAGEGVVVSKLDPINVATAHVTWPATTLTLPAINPPDQYWIAVDSAGNLLTSSVEPSTQFLRQNIFLGTVGASADNPAEIGTPIAWPITAQSTADTVVDIHRNFIPPNFLAGGRISAGVASPQPNLQVQIEAGRAYAYNANFHNNPASPNEIITPALDPLIFDEVDQTGARNRSSVTDWNTTQFDLGGVVTPITVGEAVNHRLFYDIVGARFICLLGQITYASLQEAINQIPNGDAATVLPSFLEEGTLFCGWFSCLQGATDATDTSEVNIRSADGVEFKGSGQVVTDLDGLTDVQLVSRRERQRLVFDQGFQVWKNQWDDQELVWSAQPVGAPITDGLPVTFDGTNWVAADAASEVAEGIAYNSRLDPDISPTEVADVCFGGVLYMQGHGFPSGALIYLAVGGGLSLTPPTGPSDFKQALMRVITADHLMVFPPDASYTPDPDEGLTDRVSDLVTQAAHGFSQGDQVYQDSAGTWQLAQADSLSTLKKATVNNPTADVFEAVLYGRITWSHGLNANDTYYVSAVNAGQSTSIAPEGLSEYQQVAFTTEGPNNVRVLDQTIYENSVTRLI